MFVADRAVPAYRFRQPSYVENDRRFFQSRGI
jgi:hypothetical protein